MNAPQALLLDPAVKAVADHAAPAIGAFLDLGDDAGCRRAAIALVGSGRS